MTYYKKLQTGWWVQTISAQQQWPQMLSFSIQKGCSNTWYELWVALLKNGWVELARTTRLFIVGECTLTSMMLRLPCIFPWFSMWVFAGHNKVVFVDFLLRLLAIYLCWSDVNNFMIKLRQCDMAGMQSGILCRKQTSSQCMQTIKSRITIRVSYLSESCMFIKGNI